MALELKLAKTAPEHAAMTARGDFDLAYTNHHLTPGNDAAGYRVFARPREAAPLVAHPRVPREPAAAVRAALLAMADDPEGAKILAAGAQLLKLDPPFGFVAADDLDYDNARSFLRASVLKEDER